VTSAGPAPIAEADMADWVTVTAYLFAAWVSARAARQAVLRSAARDSLFWRIAAVLLVLLGLDELLDAQSCLHPSATRMRRHMAGMESTGGAILLRVGIGSDGKMRRHCDAVAH
jgi:hypothetical protein